MDFIKTWILAIVSTAAVGSVVLMLCPAGSMEKTVKTVVSLLLLLVFLSPASRGELSALRMDNFVSYPDEDLSVDGAVVLSGLAENEIKKIISEILNEASVEYNDISVSAYVSGNEVVVERITLDLTERNEAVKERVLSLLEEKIGYEVEIEVSDD